MSFSCQFLDTNVFILDIITNSDNKNCSITFTKFNLKPDLRVTFQGKQLFKICLRPLFILYRHEKYNFKGYNTKSRKIQHNVSKHLLISFPLDRHFTNNGYFTANSDMASEKAIKTIIAIYFIKATQQKTKCV